MLQNLKIKCARWLAPDYFRETDERVNQRVAQIINQMDPFEPLLKRYHGVFSQELEHPETKLDARSQLLMKTWGYQQRDDPSFKYLTEWIMNTQGNNTIRKGRNENEWFFGRACIVTVELFVKEVGRLASLYEEMLKKDEDFNSELPVE